MSKRAMAASFLGAAALATFVVRSAAADDKVFICHYPPGNPSNVQIIEVSVSAVPAHLAHGDDLSDGERCIEE